MGALGAHPGPGPPPVRPPLPPAAPGRAARAGEDPGRGRRPPPAQPRGPLARLLRLPYVPVTANMLMLGRLGLLMYFPAKFKLRVLDPVHFDVPPDQDRYSRSRIMDEAEGIRVRLQETLYEMLRQRKSVWFG